MAFHRLTRTATEKEQDIVTRESLHRDFHLSLIGAGSSDWHQFYVRVLNLHGERYRRIILPDRIRSAEYVSQVDEEHRQLMELCLNRDADGASSLLKQHRNRSREDLINALSSL